MAIEISPNIQSLLNYLKKSQLVSVTFEPTKLWVRFDFTFGPQGEDIVIQLFKVVHFILSKELDNNECSFFVARIELIPIKDGGKDILSSLNYPYKKTDKTTVTYLDNSLFHLSIEGELCIEVVCGDYQVFKEVK